jgi:hypothetical protein
MISLYILVYIRAILRGILRQQLLQAREAKLFIFLVRDLRDAIGQHEKKIAGRVRNSLARIPLPNFGTLYMG